MLRGKPNFKPRMHTRLLTADCWLLFNWLLTDSRQQAAQPTLLVRNETALHRTAWSSNRLRSSADCRRELRKVLGNWIQLLVINRRSQFCRNAQKGNKARKVEWVHTRPTDKPIDHECRTGNTPQRSIWNCSAVSQLSESVSLPPVTLWRRVQLNSR